ncbi:MAG: D-alanyl-D-alanine carboxypeptidase [Clostridiales bacterium]|jgi:D-alanyl-D-alanine carboxypeptidase (penicillin-binding protein 5/6)|nr:D-alanyl-D-alanine carboxypeptidase [Clostridiales bacterium]
MKKKLLSLFSVFVTLCVLLPSVNVNAAGFTSSYQPQCSAIELVNLNTGAVVYEKNPNKKQYPASTTKIMTYIIASEKIKDLDGTKITVSKKVVDKLLGTGSSLSGIQVNDVLTAKQLLNLMMVPSGNDAALVLADYVGGGDVDAFVDLMNQKAKQLGCTGTHFVNPHGLQDENHYTTAHDLALITKYAMSLPYFTEITSQTVYRCTPVGGPRAGTTFSKSTTNLLINKNGEGGGKYYYQYAKGIKTGHTDEAGYCLVSTATAEGSTYLCVALGAPSVDANGKAITTRGEMIDSAELYRWAFKNLQMKSIVKEQDTLAEIPLDYAWNKDSLRLVAQKNCQAMLPNNVSTGSVIIKTNVPSRVSAPVKKGQVIGTATLSYADQTLGTVNLVAAESVERSEVLHTADKLKAVFTSVWFLIIAGIIILLLIIYIVLALIYNRKKKHLRKVKKYRKM